MKTLVPLILALWTLTGCHEPSAAQAAPPAHPIESVKAALKAAPPVGETLTLPEAEWKKTLTPKQFEILRKQGTERAFTGPHLKEKRPGLFVCGGCGAPLFTTADKFTSGTGWPSFTQPVQEGRVAQTVDRSHGMSRTEVHCARCGGHLGHVFPDGPAPTGLRYCINGEALDFQPER